MFIPPTQAHLEALEVGPGLSGPLSPEQLQKLSDAYLQRREGCTDLELLTSLGGMEGLAANLETDLKDGLPTSAVPEKLFTYGPNKLEFPAFPSYWRFWCESSRDWVLRLLIIAGIAEIVFEEIERHDPAVIWLSGAFMILSGVTIISISAYLNRKMEWQFFILNQAAQKNRVVGAVRGGELLSALLADEIVVGDLVLLSAGSELPADGLVVHGFGLSVDESALTGEGRAIKKDTLPNCLKMQSSTQKQPLLDNPFKAVPSPVLLSGTRIMSGSGRMLVTAVGRLASDGRLRERALRREHRKTPLQQKLERLYKHLAIIGIVMAIVVFLILAIRYIVETSTSESAGWSQEDPYHHFMRLLHYFLLGITLLVTMIPESLPLAVALALSAAFRALLREQNLVRKLQSCETMGGVNIICSDKTGTLTKNQMHMVSLWNRSLYNVYNSETGTYEAPGPEVDETVAAELQAALLLSSSEVSTEAIGNPTERALVAFAVGTGFSKKRAQESYQQVFFGPFSSERKLSSAVCRCPDGRLRAYLKGASAVVLERCQHFRELASGESLPLDDEFRRELSTALRGMEESALRTLIVAVKLLDDFPDDLKLEHDHKYAFEHSGFEFLGLCALRDVIRPEVPDALRKLSRAGVQVKMLTGDSRRTALAIARETGLLNPQNEARALILDGPEFSRRIGGLRVANAEEIQRAEAEGRQVAKVEQVGDPEEFRRICKDLIVLSSARPEDKYALVVGLRQMGNLVAVTGDGTNDGPALNQADVGFAMGVNGTDIAKQAASIILLDDDFASIVSAVRWGRTVYDSVRKFVQWELTLNVVALVVTFVAAVALGEVVVVGVQLLWVSLIIETSGAFALAFEPPSEDVFDRDPHKRDEYIVSPSMLKQIIGQSVLQLAVLFVLIFLGERFLFDVIGRRQLQPGSDILIFSGRKRDGFDQELNDEDYSIHYTYVFNVFALFQWFNLFNCRAIDDRRWNVFAGIWKSKYLLIMAGSSLALHIVFVTFAGSAFRVAKWGLDPLSWLLCLGLAGLTLLWGMLLRAVPLDRWVGRMVSKRLARHKGKDIANRLALEVVR